MFSITERVSRFRSWAGELLDRADRSLCAGQDERARARGWTVTRTGFGARRYRDPRFDALKGAARVGAGAPWVPEALPPARSGSWS
ncbi:hypothetical protein [Nonomuraea basaltis]|uniref:hypothetical protein n=1 Tax=Nonomuraea basaltis TaxID=2495887 RepID=UPI00110C4170|nr:hypothetical protein [Nonomuraea basaltis]TMR90559.1 hypothetical protein EJK15_54680 [Nonomuraea basaltis]